MQGDADDLSKVALEIRKLRWDLSVWARATAVAVPIAAFIVAASQVAIAWWDTSSTEQLQQQDFNLKQVESGVNLVQFTTSLTAKFLSTKLDDRSQAFAYAATLLPAAQACKVINAVIIASPAHADFVAPAQDMRELLAQQVAAGQDKTACTDPSIYDVQNKIAVALARAAQSAEAPQVVAAATPPRLPEPPPRQSPAAVPAPAPPTPAARPSPAPALPSPAVAPPVVSAPAATAPAPATAPSSATPASCQKPADTSVLPLVVYYQIVQQQDRELASRIGFAMPDEFPSAGIEFVPERDPAGQHPQVRFYQPNQQDAAGYLACLLTAAYTRNVGEEPMVGGRPVPFTPQSLVGKYTNLPAKRVEVWFPAIAGGSG